MKYLFLVLLLILTSSCGYRFERGFEGRRTISVPYVQGDFEGNFTDALVRAVSQSGAFEYERTCGRLSLEVVVQSDDSERVGFRHDRSNSTNKLRKNIIGVENRRTLCAQVTLIDTVTEEIILGPYSVKDSLVFDYLNENSPEDTSFIDSAGIRETSIAFSLGQLDSKDFAEKDALYPLYQKLAQKIIDGILAYDSNE
ncbi:MAG TPA: hypothetical protein VLG76_00220 [Rhabdochlamydiaceae bacterium]|nr:hypothetical protein [Rhabdochlamydiaceae bacterium]